MTRLSAAAVLAGASLAGAITWTITDHTPEEDVTVLLVLASLLLSVVLLVVLAFLEGRSEQLPPHRLGCRLFQAKSLWRESK